VHVQASIAIDLVYVDGGQTVATELAHLFPTIDGLFDIILDALDQNAYEVSFVYDESTEYLWKSGLITHQIWRTKSRAFGSLCPSTPHCSRKRPSVAWRRPDGVAYQSQSCSLSSSKCKLLRQRLLHFDWGRQISERQRAPVYYRE